MFFICFFLMLLAASLSAGQLNVPSEYPTLSDAISAASNCDTIVIEPGEYSGPGWSNFHLDATCQTIMSSGGADSTIIQLNSEWFIRVSDTLSSGTGKVTLEGLTFVRGNKVLEYLGHTSLSAFGCSFDSCYSVVFDSSAAGGVGTYRDCRFVRGQYGAWLDGWIQTARHPELRFEQCLFAYNNTGIMAQGDTNVTIVDNVFAYQSYEALRLFLTEDYTVTGNLLYRNHYGITDDLWTVHIEFSCNTFYGNDYNSFNFVPLVIGQDGNIEADPLFCDSTLMTTTDVETGSPLLAANNECGIDIGNVVVGCTCCRGMAGDCNGDGINGNPVDLACLVDFLYASSNSISCPYETDLNNDGMAADPADLATLIDILFGGRPHSPCPDVP